MSYHTFQVTPEELPTVKLFLETTISSLTRYAKDVDDDLHPDSDPEKYSTSIDLIESFNSHRLILENILEQINITID